MENRNDLLWSQLHALTVIAQLGSFTKAAQRLGMSKAAISQRISELERAIGQTLVQRTTRSVRLTDAGQRLVDDSSDSFAQIARSLAQARDAAGQPRGLLRVTAPVALGRQHVAPQLEGFFRKYPEVRIELDLSDRIMPLAQEGFDLAIRHTSTPPESHVAFKLCGSRTLLLASSAYVKRCGLPQHPSELAEHACLTYLRPGPVSWLFERQGPVVEGLEAERHRVSVTGPLRAGNSEVLRDAALAGLGLALLPDFSAAAAQRAGRLRELLPDWRPVGVFGDSIYAIHPWSSTTPRPVRLLVEHLREALRGGFEAAAAPLISSRQARPDTV
ncbi:MAG: LysR family transcriptional regulator [Burkholderiaceae bacterium]|nr:LysR family transcriptional regulator [Burkholderiaceae bacterium]